MADKISIIVPIYNVEKYIQECLDSIVNQTYQDLEIILVDDGSPDKCGAICDEYAQKDNRIIVIHQENQGVSVARNVGIEKASGEWIMFVDPDDWLELDCCEKVQEKAQTAQWDIVYFQMDEYDDAGRLVFQYPKIGSFQLTQERIRKLQLEGLAAGRMDIGFEAFAPWGKIYRRHLLVQHDCRFPRGIKKRQDLIFNLYCLEYTRLAYYYDYVGYHYREAYGSIWRRHNMEMMEIMFSVLRESEAFVSKHHKGETAYERMLGVEAISLLLDIRVTMFFHPDSLMRYRDYCKYMKQYYNNGIVKRYLEKCNMGDFKTIKEKINYMLVSGHHAMMYYYAYATKYHIKLVLSSLNQH